MAAAEIIAAARPDALLLTNFDYDHEGVALAAFADRVAALGHALPHRFALPPNTGQHSGADMDGDGRLGEPEDAQGYGWFAGDGGMALLSTLPVEAAAAEDFSHLLWQQVPGAELPTLPDPEASLRLALQRLSTKGHWTVPLTLPGGGRLTLMLFSATPPVFDGPEDFNGRRNADEIGFWRHWLDGAFGPVPDGPIALLGNANLDPADGDGRRQAVRDLLDDPRLQDPRPRSTAGALSNDPDHLGDPGLDTADWPAGAPGNLRVAYVLPGAGLAVTGAGVFWPLPGTPMSELVEGPRGGPAGPHRLVWTDVRP